MDDVSKALSFEIKKEIADRYFGFRRMVEQDIKGYNEQVMASSRQLEEEIGRDFVRIQILLRDQDLIEEFHNLIGLDELIFYDPYVVNSPTIRARLFADQRVRGLTRSGRFHNMLFDTYERLVRHVAEYRETLMELAEERDTIAEEIRLFHRNNDISAIMGFLRGMDAPTGMGDLEGGLHPMRDSSLEAKMRVSPPPPVDELLPMIPLPPTLDDIRGPLKRLADQAFARHGMDLRGI